MLRHIIRQKNEHTVPEMFTEEEQVSHFRGAVANIKEILNYFLTKISLTLLGLPPDDKKKKNTGAKHSGFAFLITSRHQKDFLDFLLAD